MDAHDETAAIAAGRGTATAARAQLAERIGALVAEGAAAEHRFVLAPRSPPDDPHLAFAQAARIAHELAVSFSGSDPPLELGGGGVGVLVPIDDAYRANLIRASIAIGRLDGEARAHVAGLPLPDRAEEIGAFVGFLGSL